MGLRAVLLSPIHSGRSGCADRREMIGPLLNGVPATKHSSVVLRGKATGNCSSKTSVAGAVHALRG